MDERLPLDLPLERTCTKCRLVKPLDEFSKQKGGKYGRKASCKACDAARHARLHPPSPRKPMPSRRGKPNGSSLFIGPDSRECGRCRGVKPYERFSPRGYAPDGTRVYKSTCKDCAAEQARGWYAENTEQGLTNRRRLQLKQNYGLTPEEYDALLEEQGGVCAICKQPERMVDFRSKRPHVRLPVDHDHETGRVRGLLCHRCNRALGLLGDDVLLLREAINYLQMGCGYNQ